MSKLKLKYFLLNWVPGPGRVLILFDGDGSLNNLESTKGLKDKTLWDTLCRLGHMLLDTE